MIYTNIYIFYFSIAKITTLIGCIFHLLLGEKYNLVKAGKACDALKFKIWRKQNQLTLNV